jgi:hypothetical protein
MLQVGQEANIRPASIAARAVVEAVRQKAAPEKPAHAKSVVLS